MTAPLSPRELELLELLVDASEQHPDDLFLVTYTNAGTPTVHPSLDASEGEMTAKPERRCLRA
jgi:hypothetical protein